MSGRRRAALVLVVVTLSGCARWKVARDAEAAVRTYDEAITVAYRTNDPRGLDQVAGAAEVRRLIALIDLKRNANLALESRLEDFQVLGVEAASDAGAIVRTRERWRYWDRPLKPGMPAGSVFVADMWMTWTLGREGGRLKVLEGRTERSEYIEPKGFRPGSGAREHGPGSRPAVRAKEGT